MQSVLDLARLYTSEGLAVLPVPQDKGECTVKGWPEIKITQKELPAYFNGKAQNIAGLFGAPSGDVVCIDLDWPEAAAIAKRILPVTPTYGRGADLYTHVLLKVPGQANVCFKVPRELKPEERRTVIVEVLADRKQCLLPGSDHPKDGDRVQFVTGRRIGEVPYVEMTSEELTLLVSRIAGASLLTLHWNDLEGSRHELALALTGSMLHAGWLPQDIATVLDAVWDVCDEAERQDRRQCILDTCQQHKAGGNVMGWPSASVLLGDIGPWIKECWDLAKPFSLASTTTPMQAATTPTLDPLAALKAMALTKEQAEAMIDATYIIRNLIVEGHIVAICAPPGGGKTTITFNLAPEMVQAGYNVTFIHADTGPAEAKPMVQFAHDHGFTYVTPDLSPEAEQDVEHTIRLMVAMVEQKQSLTGEIFVIDTLKKVADMNSKGSLKQMLTLFRRLTGLGATVVLLCHTNKYKTTDGKLVHEGVGDLRADVDELIYFEPWQAPEGVLQVSTIVDKKRAVLNPMTFDISPGLKVTLNQDYVDTVAANEDDEYWDKDHLLVACIRRAMAAGNQVQSHIVDWVKEHWKLDNPEEINPGHNRVIAVLKRYKRGSKRQWECREGAEFNANEYILLDAVKPVKPVKHNNPDVTYQ